MSLNESIPGAAAPPDRRDLAKPSPSGYASQALRLERLLGL